MTVLPDVNRAILLNSALRYLSYNYNALRASEQAAVLPQASCHHERDLPHAVRHEILPKFPRNQAKSNPPILGID